jgi:uncharacterized protein YjdB
MTPIVSGSSDLATVTFADAAGNPSPVDPATIAWGSSDPTIAAVTPGADPTTATVAAIKAGTATITVTSGSVTVSGQVTVTAGPAVAGQLSFGPVTVPG